MLDRVARPPLEALSERRLKASMPVETFAGHEQDRRKCTYLEALGRTLAGIAPWLEHGARSGLMDISNQRARIAGLTLTDPEVTMRDMRAWIKGENITPALSPEREMELIRISKHKHEH